MAYLWQRTYGETRSYSVGKKKSSRGGGDSKESKKGRKSRNKGAGFERLIAKDLREALGLGIEDEIGRASCRERV